jgi:adenylate cyclase
LLEDHGGVEVVGVAPDYNSLLQETRRLRPDAVLMDIKMPPTYSTEGIDAAHVIKRELPGTGVVMLTQHDDEVYVWRLLAHGVAGYGYLHKVRVGDIDQLVRAVEEVATDGSVLDPTSSRGLSTIARRSQARRWSSLLLGSSTSFV